MKNKEKLLYLHKALDMKFSEQFGFSLREITCKKLANYMFQPKDSSSLAITRILFGLAMLFDIPDERGGAVMKERWGNPLTCHFPLVPFIKAVPMPYMALVYTGLWLGALGIMLGYKFRQSSITFTVCFWYLLLIDKSYWNNHSYLFGLVALLFSFTRANCLWSIDAYLDPTCRSDTVPYWNYFILKYQFFILYFMAGLKKGTAEWLTGYSVQNLSEHWVFYPFKFFLTVPQIDYLVVHWFIFIFDLTVAVWMMWSRTRHIAMVFCALFHLMNSRLFRIGMFPWVCLGTMPLFYPFDWPRVLINRTKEFYLKWKMNFENLCIHQAKNQCKQEENDNDESNHLNKNKDEITAGETDDSISNITEGVEKKEMENDKTANINVSEAVETNDKEGSEKKNDLQNVKDMDEWKRLKTLFLIIIFIIIQAFLPFSHFITKGYNNWTNGLYGYSWDMMVHTWDIHSIVVKVVDNERNIEFFIDPYYYTPNDRWAKHGDMIRQYARCLKENLLKETQKHSKNPESILSKNLSIYIDVWCSLNGRFTQRMFNSKTDILNVEWSPFSPVEYLIPLLDEALHWREDLHKIKENVLSWNNNSDVIFIADLPGYEYEKFIPVELKNVTLRILEGVVVYESEVMERRSGQSYQLKGGNWISIAPDSFHKVINIGDSPAYYMYTFYNSSETNTIVNVERTSQLPIGKELWRRFTNMGTFMKNVITSIFQIFFDNSKCLAP